MDSTKELDDEASRVHESCLLASETQYANSRIWRMTDHIVAVSAAVAAAVAGVAGLADIITAQWAGGIAIVSAALGAVSTSLGAGRITANSSVAANSYRNLQQDVRVYRNIDLSSLESEDAVARLKELITRQQELNANSPVPCRLAFSLAKKNVERGGQSYEVDQQ
jgi:hypothetical protein